MAELQALGLSAVSSTLEVRGRLLAATTVTNSFPQDRELSQRSCRGEGWRW